MTRTELPLSELYVDDETAWLEEMAELIRSGVYTDLDYANLQEYLTEMARRDRREVESRLIVLLAHLLKWTHQPGERTGGWRATVIAQRQELEALLASGVLRNHAEAMLEDAYQKAIQRAAAETGLAFAAFPDACPFALDALLNDPLP